MRKTVLAAAALALLTSGCGAVQRQQAHWGGHTKVCVEGHTYIQFPTGTVEQREDDGVRPVLCGAKKAKADAEAKAAKEAAGG